MKLHGLAIAAFVLAVLTWFLYWSDRHKPADETSKLSADTPPAILKLDQNSITKLELKKKDADPVVLTKSGSGDWQITAPKPFRADQSAVTGIASTVSSLNSERLVEDKASDLQNFGLEHPELEVDLTAKDKTQKLLLGADTPAGGAVYAMLSGDPRLFTVSSYTKTSLDKNLNDLRDKRLLPVDADKVSQIEVVRKNGDIEFGRNKDNWQILKPKPMRADSVQVGDLVRDLTNAKMDLSTTDAKQEASEFAHGAPVATAKLTDESGTQQLQVRKSKDNYYAKSSAVEGAYKVDSGLGKTLEKNLDDFRDKKLFDFGYNTPNKLELHNADKAYFLTRGTGGFDDWWSNGKKMDGANVESLISDLRDLSASSFPATGFASPAINISVVSQDGKHTEKVEVAKSGDHYIARRENDPALYELSAASVDSLLKAAQDLKPSTNQPSQKRR
ncbi:MAG TPA: DUF4340 domain-containing protein [Terriglobales bacterium]|jgi:hypothetical protein|nr:DUF4340 domain-containing protein [Terriglobales bacterium]